MGFFSNLTNSLTGNWADVSVMMPSASRGQTAAFTVNVAVKDEAIAIEQVVVQIRCQEVIDLPNYAVGGSTRPSNTAVAKHGTSTATASRTSVHVRHTESVFDQEVVVAGAQSLGANTQYTFEGTVTLPTHVPPTLQGRHARYEWRITAAVEMRGNDPDSGWQEVEVR